MPCCLLKEELQAKVVVYGAAVSRTCEGEEEDEEW